MQLTKSKSIRAALAAATCGVLGTAQAGAPSSDAWDVDATFLYYAEADRVSVIAPGFIASKAIGEDEFFTLTGIFDTLTGASPTGAAPGLGGNCTPNPAGILCATTPSGSIINTKAGELPMNDFDDTRGSLSVDWDNPLSRLTRNKLSASVSAETDYFSLGLSDTYTREFNNRHTTLAVGAGLTLDTVDPEGGAPVPMQSFSDTTWLEANTTTSASGEGEQKNTVDLLVGVTQVVNRRTLVQLNYSRAMSSGYLNDPYKYLSIVDPVSGQTLDYLYEARPEERNTNVLYGKVVYHLPEDVVHASVRLFNDDWGISSTTFDLHYRYELAGGMYLKPHLRLYQQSAANFYRHSLIAGQDAVLTPVTLPADSVYRSQIDYASSDMRLAEMQSTTWGLKFGMPIGKSELSLRIEQMVQTGDSNPADAIGVQKNYNMYPDLEATIVQMNYSFLF